MEAMDQKDEQGFFDWEGDTVSPGAWLVGPGNQDAPIAWTKVLGMVGESTVATLETIDLTMERPLFRLSYLSKEELSRMTTVPKAAVPRSVLNELDRLFADL